MRPPEFTGGNPNWYALRRSLYNASMRPPEFTGGNDDNMNAEAHRKIVGLQ